MKTRQKTRIRRENVQKNNTISSNMWKNQGNA